MLGTRHKILKIIVMTVIDNVHVALTILQHEGLLMYFLTAYEVGSNIIAVLHMRGWRQREDE